MPLRLSQDGETILLCACACVAGGALIVFGKQLPWATFQRMEKDDRPPFSFFAWSCVVIGFATITAAVLELPW